MLLYVSPQITYFANNLVDIDELEALAAEGDEGKDDNIDAKVYTTHACKKKKD